jgi:hypothetical protein
MTKKTAGLCALSVVFVAGIALADSPHFTSASAAFASGSNDLVISLKEAGLGANVNVDYLASATENATWACLNGGGKNPTAANKRVISTPISQPATLSSGKNGSVTGTITIKASPQPAPEEFSCPSGQTLALAAIAYADVKLVDKTNWVSATFTTTTFTKTVITLK